MKKSRRLLWALAVLLLAGCSLARPAHAPRAGEDRWIGFYVVRENSPENGRNLFYSNPHLVEYGSSSVELEEYGSFDIPQKVLFAEEKENRFIFPDLAGYSIYILNGTYADGGEYVRAVCDMAPSEGPTASTYTDEGTAHSISGTIYVGPAQGQEDWNLCEDRSIWTAYRVYQTSDGRPYLDGSGNSFSGGMFSYREEQTYTSTEDGAAIREDRISVSVAVRETPRLERLVVTQFGENNAAVRSDDLALREELPEIYCEPETAWVLVEEISRDGTVRTVYNVPEDGADPISHMVVLLDGEGLGRLAYLSVRRQAADGGGQTDF